MVNSKLSIFLSLEPEPKLTVLICDVISEHKQIVLQNNIIVILLLDPQSEARTQCMVWKKVIIFL